MPRRISQAKRMSFLKGSIGKSVLHPQREIAGLNLLLYSRLTGSKRTSVPKSYESKLGMPMCSESVYVKEVRLQSSTAIC
ncbi:hypothetical protein D3C85_1317460 [compost metagenome]